MEWPSGLRRTCGASAPGRASRANSSDARIPLPPRSQGRPRGGALAPVQVSPRAGPGLGAPRPVRPRRNAPRGPSFEVGGFYDDLVALEDDLADFVAVLPALAGAAHFPDLDGVVRRARPEDLF